ncbi:MAG: helix-turn-helix domain-containing protein [Pseudonocardiaceae bacterium]
MDGTSDRAGEQAGHKIGPELRRLRTEQGLSLAALAQRVHYSTGYLSKIETGKKPVTPELARRLDEALETDGVLAALLPLPEGPIPADDEPLGAGVCPYPGLAAFGPAQAQWFFGRHQAISDLVSQLDDRLAGGGLLAVVAPSGAGKSSLLAAGLIPALVRGGLPGSRAWPVVATTPGTHPLATLVARVAERTGVEQAAVEQAGDPDGFVAFLTEAVAACTGKPRETSSSARVVLIVDQFEEIFTECRTESERQVFVAALGAAARSAVALVVLGVRADFYGPCLAYPVLLTALQGPVALGPMSAEQLRAVITRPAQAEGLGLEPGLVELLLRDLGVAEDAGVDAAGYDPGALPLLAHALRTTWQQGKGQTLTVAGYRRTGGIRQALATTAERAYTRLSPAERQIARQVLLRLVNVSDQDVSGDTRRRLSRARLVETLPLPGSAEVLDTVLEAFGRARLLTFDTASTLDTDSVEITHEALLRSWPRLRQWIDTDRAGNLIRQELDAAAAGWDREGRDTAGLYRGARLATARTWATSTTQSADLSPVASAFLAASTQQEHHAARLRRAVLVVLSVLALVVSGAVGVALHQSVAAQRERDTALFNQITAQADRLRGTDTSLAAQLDLTAYRMRPMTRDLYTALVTDANAALATPLNSPTNAIYTVVFSPDGRILATGGDDQAVRLWNVSAPTHPVPVGSALTGHTKTVYAVAFSPDGHTLASGSADHRVRLWNVADPAHPAPLGPPLTGHTKTVLTVAFSPDGRTLATGSRDQTVRLWNVADPTHPAPLGPPLLGHTDDVRTVVFSPDGRTLATTGGDDQTVRLWNVADPAHPALLGSPLTGYTKAVFAVVFSPDGRTLATSGRDHMVRVWNVADPAHPTSLGPPLPGHRDDVNAVAFSPDGRILASGSDDRTVRLWNMADPAHPVPLGLPLTGHISAIETVAFSPDGHTLAVGSHDHTALLWNIPAAPLTGHTNAVTAMAFSPDGHTLASGGADRTVRLWNMTDLAHPVSLGSPLIGHTNDVTAVAFSPDGRTLASGGDRTVRLWNVTDSAHPVSLGPVLTGYTDSVTAVAFSPDGHTLATGEGQMVRLWNVADPAHPISLGPPLTGHTKAVYAVVFSPDGRTLASAGGDQMVRLWNVADPARPAPLGLPLTGHTNIVYALAFSPDGHTLASGSNDTTVQLWDVADPARPAALGPPLIGHTNSVHAVAFSPDGHTLASGGYDETVRLWEVTDPAHPMALGQPLTGHTGWVYAVAFSPDGRTLASGGEDRTIRLWGTDVDQAIQRICAFTANTLTPATWQQYVSPDVPYHSPCP